MTYGNYNETDLAISALEAIPTPPDRETWLNITMAFKSWTEGAGFYEWDVWCQRGEGYNEAQNKATWESIDPNGKRGAGTLYNMAKAHGWTDPRQSKKTPAYEEYRQLNRYVPSLEQEPEPTAQSTPLNLPVMPAPDHPSENFLPWKHDYQEIMQQATMGNLEALRLYMKQRGITAQTVKAWNLGVIDNYACGHNVEVRFIIPYPERKYYRARLMGSDYQGSPKYLCPRKDNIADKATGDTWGGKPLFNPSALRQSTKPVFVLEGEIDCITLEQAGYRAVATNESQLANEITPKTEARKFIIIPDQDETGTRKAESRLEELERKHRTAIIFPLPKGEHDVNAFWCHNQQEFLAWCTDAERALQRHIASQLASISALRGLDELQRDIQSPDANKPIPTGFPLLDSPAHLGGGLYAGLYTIGAISSLGKTTFALQIADQIAQGGHDVIVFSLEMATKELIAKSISRLTSHHVSNAHDGKVFSSLEGVSVRQIMNHDTYINGNPETRQRIVNAMNQYRQEIAPHLFIVEGIGDVSTGKIGETVERHIDQGGQRPVVVLDYLQIVAQDGEERKSLTDKQVIDQTVVSLKRLSRDCDIPVIAISSLNRTSYTSKISMEAYKESGAIEYSSDVLFGLQLLGAGDKDFDVDTAKAQTPRQIQLLCLKQRNGRTGWKLDYHFYSAFNKFMEV